MSPSGRVSLGSLARSCAVWARSCAVLAGSCAVLAGGCTNSCAPKRTSPANDVQLAVPKAPEQPPPEREVGAERRVTSYSTAIRSGDYELAAKLLDQVSESEAAKPEVRFARAWVAVQLGDVEAALALAERLAEQAPSYGEEIEQLRLDAAKRAGDVTVLAHLLGKPSGPNWSDHLLLVKAERDNRMLGAALERVNLLVTALGKEKNKRDQVVEAEAEAHLLKAELLEALDKPNEAAAQYRWLATQAPGQPAAREAAEHLARLAPDKPLSASQRLRRAEEFSDRGWPDRTEQELEALADAPGAPSSAGRQAELLAWALYGSRSDYPRAARKFAEAAAAPGTDRRKNLYYEAKSWARAHDHEQAIDKYEAVAKLGGAYADHALYQAARLRYIDGKWKAAIESYKVYQRLYSRGRHRSAVEYELAISQLASGQGKQARLALKKLYDAERSSRHKARLLQLIGVAHELDDQQQDAATLYERVIEERPLSLPALFADSRLRKLGRTPPALIDPASSQSNVEVLPVALPEKVAGLNRVGLDQLAENNLRALESSIRQQYGNRKDEALCRLYDQLAQAKRQYQVAQTAASWVSLAKAPGAGTDWQWQCIYPRPYPEVVASASQLYDVDEAFIYAVMRQESAFRPAVVSPAAAVGLMQVIPPTAKKIAEETGHHYKPELMSKPGTNIIYGAYYLRRLLDMFADHRALVAASYNAGPHAVTSWLAGGETLPLDIFVARIPYRETRNYVYRVLGNYARYLYLEGKLDQLRVELEIPKGLEADADAY